MSGKFNGNHVSDKEKPELIYVFDALCGWCYGFSPVMTKLFEDFRQQADFLVLSGGMVRKEDARPASAMADYIKSASRVVEDTAGVKFGKKFLEETLTKDDVLFYSVPPAKALAVFRLDKPGETVEFAARLQKAIYYDGIHVDDNAAYAEIAAEFGLDARAFEEQMEKQEIERIVENEFRMAEGLGVKGYPTVILRKGKDMTVLSRGYKDYPGMAEVLRQNL